MSKLSKTTRLFLAWQIFKVLLIIAIIYGLGTPAARPVKQDLKTTFSLCAKDC